MPATKEAKKRKKVTPFTLTIGQRLEVIEGVKIAVTGVSGNHVTVSVMQELIGPRILMDHDIPENQRG